MDVYENSQIMQFRFSSVLFLGLVAVLLCSQFTDAYRDLPSESDIIESLLARLLESEKRDLPPVPKVEEDSTLLEILTDLNKRGECEDACSDPDTMDPMYGGSEGECMADCKKKK
ncbi:unnamed protein product [Owenia fusiformis]|uniref:Uncharacterized protein n=1 Tax=Owenia fusiformis TaxID=6347 RepID=A0A8J1UT72_OWEFU|nr:unnamed protein product [Owenia fusiformis]